MGKFLDIVANVIDILILILFGVIIVSHVINWFN
jgi:hypothetical protein